MRRPALVVLLTAAALAVGTPAVAAPASHGKAAVRFDYLGETELPHALQYGGTTVGGLSAISWDRRTGRWAIISDDRSATGPARFYEAAIAARRGAVSVSLTAVHPFTQADGSVFPPTGGGAVAPDPEGIAVDPARHRIAWSSEGERIVPPDGLVLADPAVRFATPAGRTTAVLPAAPQLHANVQEVGPRRNQSLEGLSFTPDGRSLITGMEDPLFQDGADPTPGHGALVRLTRVDARTGLPVAQVA